MVVHVIATQVLNNKDTRNFMRCDPFYSIEYEHVQSLNICYLLKIAIIVRPRPLIY